MRIEASSVEDYLSKTGDYEPQLHQLDELIQENAPNLKRDFLNTKSTTMIAYGMMPYETRTPGITEWPLVALAAQKNYMALYICALNKNGEYTAENHKSELGKVSVGKSCIRFKKLEDLNLETVRKLLKDLDKRYAAGEKLF